MSNCLCRYASFYKTVEKFFFPESTIETIANFREVCL